MKNLEDAREIAEKALADGEYEVAVKAASVLIEAGEPWLLDGLVRRAMALENWAEGPPDRLAGAAEDWARMVEIAPAAVSYLGLARVLLKLGDRESAYNCLLEAESRGATPETLLGFAQYHRTSSPPDLRAAKTYFLRAALRGRTQGIRGYVEVAYELDQPYSGAAMTLVGIMLSPVLALALGERRHSSF